jgi:hypothetical protein
MMKYQIHLNLCEIEPQLIYNFKNMILTYNFEDFVLFDYSFFLLYHN